MKIQLLTELHLCCDAFRQHFPGITDTKRKQAISGMVFEENTFRPTLKKV
jgi:hypothetical protein